MLLHQHSNEKNVFHEVYGCNNDEFIKFFNQKTDEQVQKLQSKQSNKKKLSLNDQKCMLRQRIISSTTKTLSLQSNHVNQVINPSQAFDSATQTFDGYQKFELRRKSSNSLKLNSNPNLFKDDQNQQKKLYLKHIFRNSQSASHHQLTYISIKPIIHQKPQKSKSLRAKSYDSKWTQFQLKNHFNTNKILQLKHNKNYIQNQDHLIQQSIKMKPKFKDFQIKYDKNNHVHITPIDNNQNGNQQNMQLILQNNLYQHQLQFTHSKVPQMVKLFNLGQKNKFSLI